MKKLFNSIRSKVNNLTARAVVAVSFARMHKANLINSGILPLTFVNAEDYDRIAQGDEIILQNIRTSVMDNTNAVLVNKTKNEQYELTTDFSERQKDILAAGGLLNYTANLGKE